MMPGWLGFKDFKAPQQTQKIVAVPAKLILLRRSWVWNRLDRQPKTKTHNEQPDNHTSQQLKFINLHTPNLKRPKMKATMATTARVY